MKNSGSHFRRAALFIAAAMILQAIFVVFLTPQGLSKIYPYVLRFNSEKIEDDASFAEYFGLRSEFAGNSFFVLGADLGVADSYFVIFDYLRYLKKDFDVDMLALPVTVSCARAINEYLSSSAENSASALAAVTSNGVFTADFISFLKKLYNFNATLSPRRKLTVCSDYAESLRSASVSRMSTLILNNFGKSTPEVSYALSIETADEFFTYFTDHESAFRDFLSEEEFAYFTEVKAHAEEGDFNEWILSAKLETYADNAILCVVDDPYARPGSPLCDMLSESGIDAKFVSTAYCGCKTLVSGVTEEKNDFDLPFDPGHSVRFASRDEIGPFLRFYRFVSNPSGKEERRSVELIFDKFATPSFFIVVGSEASSYVAG